MDAWVDYGYRLPMIRQYRYQITVGEVRIMIGVCPEVDKIVLSISNYQGEILLSFEEAYILALQLLNIVKSSEDKPKK